MIKKTKAKSPTKAYLVLASIVTLVLLVTNVVGAWITYPTQKHREIAAQQQELIDKNGGFLNTVDTINTKKYKDLADTTEGGYIASASSFVANVQSIIFSVLLVLLYIYIRHNKISPTGRSLGATALIATVGNFISLPLAYLIAIPLGIRMSLIQGLGEWTIPAYIAGFVVILVFNFILVACIEFSYNKFGGIIYRAIKR